MCCLSATVPSHRSPTGQVSRIPPQGDGSSRGRKDGEAEEEEDDEVRRCGCSGRGGVDPENEGEEATPA